MFSFLFIQAHDHPDIFVKFGLFSLQVLCFSGGDIEISNRLTKYRVVGHINRSEKAPGNF